MSGQRIRKKLVIYNQASFLELFKDRLRILPEVLPERVSLPWLDMVIGHAPNRSGVEVGILRKRRERSKQSSGKYRGQQSFPHRASSNFLTDRIGPRPGFPNGQATNLPLIFFLRQRALSHPPCSSCLPCLPRALSRAAKGPNLSRLPRPVPTRSGASRGLGRDVGILRSLGSRSFSSDIKAAHPNCHPY